MNRSITPVIIRLAALLGPVACSSAPTLGALPSSLSPDCPVARRAIVSNPTTAAIDVFAGKDLLGTVGAQRTGEFWLASSNGGSLHFAWHAPQLAAGNADLSGVQYRIDCQAQSE